MKALAVVLVFFPGTSPIAVFVITAEMEFCGSVCLNNKGRFSFVAEVQILDTKGGDASAIPSANAPWVGRDQRNQNIDKQDAKDGYGGKGGNDAGGVGLPFGFFGVATGPVGTFGVLGTFWLTLELATFAVWSVELTASSTGELSPLSWALASSTFSARELFDAPAAASSRRKPHSVQNAAPSLGSWPQLGQIMAISYSWIWRPHLPPSALALRIDSVDVL